MSGARRPVAVLAAVALATGALLAGCGEDEETTAPVTAPTPTGEQGPQQQDKGGSGSGDQEKGTADEPTVSGEDTGTTPEATTGDTTPTDGTGGSSAPTGDGSQSDSTEEAEDTEENDVPPEPGSPADKFERFCDKNPDACG